MDLERDLAPDQCYCENMKVHWDFFMFLSIPSHKSQRLSCLPCHIPFLARLDEALANVILGGGVLANGRGVGVRSLRSCTTRAIL